ncbi:NlpC/P60 family protein [Paracoccus aurantiacus]|uniref:NlpC/P60 family protein n=1 Tax=Paracoccus aurantiacus TaxID=2599412 RepID=A0A5C6S590_9RHOB|nr:NlpC/P60 family protein [Paracoccus aurantiacus]TXB69770.1 NlpC/P60 family protein [Paracoccus aurantiacus]
MNDRRITAATDRVALSSLRGIVERPDYTDGSAARVTAPLAELLTEPGGARDRQLNLGADVTLIEERDGWAFVQAERDGYVGWMAVGDLGSALPAITHRVSAPATHIYPEPNMKRHELARLSINARLSVDGVEGGFARLAGGGFVPVQAISDGFADDPVEVAESLLGTAYLWGGNSRDGIDCSGLVQAALHGCGIACPGDADLQERAFEPVEQIERGDLLFWPGHVAMACGDGRMVHATAWAMRVIHEDIAQAIARIDAAGYGPFRGARRPARVAITR